MQTMDINSFLSLDEAKQKEYVLKLELNDFNKFIGEIKKKNLRLSILLSSHRQSNKNINRVEEKKSLNSPKLDIYEILENPMQPRKQFSNEDIEEKMQSIKSRGLITPITVLKQDEKYFLIAGQLRLEAFKRLHLEEKEQNVPKDEMKYNTINVHIKDENEYKNEDFAIDSLIENINRTDMHVLDTANALKIAFESQNDSLSSFAKVLGKSKFYLSSYLTIANFNSEFLEYVQQKDIKNPTIIYLIIQMENSLEDKKKLLDKYLNGEIKKSQLQEIKKEKYEEEIVKDKIEKKDTLQNIFSFKKSFNKTKYSKLKDDKKIIVDEKLKEIEKLQNEIFSLIQD